MSRQYGAEPDLGALRAIIDCVKDMSHRTPPGEKYRAALASERQQQQQQQGRKEEEEEMRRLFVERNQNVPYINSHRGLKAGSRYGRKATPSPPPFTTPAPFPQRKDEVSSHRDYPQRQALDGDRTPRYWHEEDGASGRSAEVHEETWDESSLLIMEPRERDSQLYSAPPPLPPSSLHRPREAYSSSFLGGEEGKADGVLSKGDNGTSSSCGGRPLQAYLGSTVPEKLGLSSFSEVRKSANGAVVGTSKACVSSSAFLGVRATPTTTALDRHTCSHSRGMSAVPDTTGSGQGSAAAAAQQTCLAGSAIPLAYRNGLDVGPRPALAAPTKDSSRSGSASQRRHPSPMSVVTTINDLSGSSEPFRAALTALQQAAASRNPNAAHPAVVSGNTAKSRASPSPLHASFASSAAAAPQRGDPLTPLDRDTLIESAQLLSSAILSLTSSSGAPAKTASAPPPPRQEDKGGLPSRAIADDGCRGTRRGGSAASSRISPSPVPIGAPPSPTTTTTITSSTRQPLQGQLLDLERPLSVSPSLSAERPRQPHAPQQRRTPSGGNKQGSEPQLPEHREAAMSALANRVVSLSRPRAGTDERAGSYGDGDSGEERPSQPRSGHRQQHYGGRQVPTNEPTFPVDGGVACAALPRCQDGDPHPRSEQEEEPWIQEEEEDDDAEGPVEERSSAATLEDRGGRGGTHQDNAQSDGRRVGNAVLTALPDTAGDTLSQCSASAAQSEEEVEAARCGASPPYGDEAEDISLSPPTPWKRQWGDSDSGSRRVAEEAGHRAGTDRGTRAEAERSPPLRRTNVPCGEDEGSQSSNATSSEEIPCELETDTPRRRRVLRRSPPHELDEEEDGEASGHSADRGFPLSEGREENAGPYSIASPTSPERDSDDIFRIEDEEERQDGEGCDSSRGSGVETPSALRHGGGESPTIIDDDQPHADTTAATTTTTEGDEVWIDEKGVVHRIMTPVRSGPTPSTDAVGVSEGDREGDVASSWGSTSGRRAKSYEKYLGPSRPASLPAPRVNPARRLCDSLGDNGAEDESVVMATAAPRCSASGSGGDGHPIVPKGSGAPSRHLHSNTPLPPGGGSSNSERDATTAQPFSSSSSASPQLSYFLANAADTTVTTAASEEDSEGQSDGGFHPRRPPLSSQPPPIVLLSVNPTRERGDGEEEERRRGSDVGDGHSSPTPPSTTSHDEVNDRHSMESYNSHEQDVFLRDADGRPTRDSQREGGGDDGTPRDSRRTAREGEAEQEESEPDTPSVSHRQARSFDQPTENANNEDELPWRCRSESGVLSEEEQELRYEDEYHRPEGGVRSNGMMLERPLPSPVYCTCGHRLDGLGRCFFCRAERQYYADVPEMHRDRDSAAFAEDGRERDEGQSPVRAPQGTAIDGPSQRQWEEEEEEEKGNGSSSHRLGLGLPPLPTPTALRTLSRRPGTAAQSLPPASSSLQKHVAYISPFPPTTAEEEEEFYDANGYGPPYEDEEADGGGGYCQGGFLDDERY